MKKKTLQFICPECGCDELKCAWEDVEAAWTDVRSINSDGSIEYGRRGFESDQPSLRCARCDYELTDREGEPIRDGGPELLQWLKDHSGSERG